MAEEIRVDRYGGDWFHLKIYSSNTLRDLRGLIAERVVARYVSESFENNGVDHVIEYGFAPVGDPPRNTSCPESIESQTAVEWFQNYLDADPSRYGQDSTLLLVDLTGGGCGSIGGNVAVSGARFLVRDKDIKIGSDEWASCVQAAMHEIGHNLGFPHNPHPGKGYNYHDVNEWHRTPTNSANGVTNLCGERIPERVYDDHVNHLYYNDCLFDHMELTNKEPLSDGSSPVVARFDPDVNYLTVSLDASKSEGDIEEYRWKSNILPSEGTGGIVGPGEITDTGVSAEFTYPEPGTYSVALTVEDSAGNVDTRSKPVTLQQPTLADFTFDVNGWDINVDASPSVGGIVSYEWVADGPGYSIPATGKTANFSIPDGLGGVWTVTLTVEDDVGGSEMASASMSVPDSDDIGDQSPPDADFKYSVSPPTVHLDSSLSSSPSGTIQSYDWDVGGAMYTGKTVDVDVDEPGDYDVTLAVTDDVGQTDSVTKTVTVHKWDMPDGGGESGGRLSNAELAVGGASLALLVAAARRRER